MHISRGEAMSFQKPIRGARGQFPRHSAQQIRQACLATMERLEQRQLLTVSVSGTNLPAQKSGFDPLNLTSANDLILNQSPTATNYVATNESAAAPGPNTA